MAENKQHFWVAGLIALAAVAVIYLLYKESQNSAQSTDATAPPATGQDIPPYPNTQPLDLPTVSTVSGAAPDSAYNTPARPANVQLTDPWDTGGCSCDKETDCSETSVLQSTQKVPVPVLQGSISNITSYKEKVTSGVEAARVTFGTTGPTTGGGSLG